MGAVEISFDAQSGTVIFCARAMRRIRLAQKRTVPECASGAGDGFGDGVGGAPGGLEVEAARDAIDIEDLSCEIDVGEVFAFEGVGIDSREIDAATGDEFVLEGGTACNLVGIVAEGVDQTVQFFLAQVLPTVLGAFARW